MTSRFDRMLDELSAESRAAEDARLDEDARRFLAALDPQSPLGEWFAALAEGFPSRAAAARAYVAECLQITNTRPRG